MAYYVSSIVPTAMDDPTGNPATSLYPFFSQQAENWANLCGANVTLLSGLNEYTGSRTSNTASRFIVFQLDSDEYIAGNSTSSSIGVYWQFYSYWRTYKWNNHIPGTGNSGAGTFSTSESLSYYTNVHNGSASTFTSGYGATCIYSDTPGKRFFVFHPYVGHSAAYLYQSAIFELQDRQHTDPNQNVQWAYLSSDSRTLMPLVSSLRSEPANPYKAYSQKPTSLPSTNFDGVWLKNIPIYTGSGLYCGYIGSDQLIWSQTSSPANSSVVYDGKTYMSTRGRIYARVA